MPLKTVSEDGKETIFTYMLATETQVWSNRALIKKQAQHP